MSSFDGGNQRLTPTKAKQENVSCFNLILKKKNFFRILLLVSWPSVFHFFSLSILPLVSGCRFRQGRETKEGEREKFSRQATCPHQHLRNVFLHLAFFFSFFFFSLSFFIVEFSKENKTIIFKFEWQVGFNFSLWVSFEAFALWKMTKNVGSASI